MSDTQRDAAPLAPAVAAQNLLSDSDFERLVLLADGELAADPAQRAAAEALLERSVQARAVFADLQGNKLAVELWATGGEAPAAGVDLSMLRGRVMSHLPAEPRAPVPQAAPASWLDGVLQGLREFGFGKTGLALGAVAVAALLLVVRARAPEPTPVIQEVPAVASHLPGGEAEGRYCRRSAECRSCAP